MKRFSKKGKEIIEKEKVKINVKLRISKENAINAI